MQPYPHHYAVAAVATGSGAVRLESPPLPVMESDAPRQFDGPGGHWSPETLLCASVADCLVLTFRALARVARLPWSGLECRVQGTLERAADRIPQFTRFATVAILSVPAGTDRARAEALLKKAKQTCLITNSLRAEHTLETQVREQAAPPLQPAG